MTDADTMDIILQVGEMSFEGNIIPQSWFEHLKYPSGKPYLTAIVILSEIVYWYRPREIRDERTGRPIRLEKKFKGDMLQRSYDSFSNQFGFTKREASEAIKYLAAEGILRLDFRTVTFDHKYKFPNVLFLCVVPERLREITHGRRPAGPPPERTPSPVETGEVLRSNGIPSYVETEHPLHSNGRPSSGETEDGFRQNGTPPSAETRDVSRLNVVPSLPQTEVPPPAKRKTNNTETKTESTQESGRERARPRAARKGAGGAGVPPGATPLSAVEFQEHAMTLPEPARGESGARRFPRAIALAAWCREKVGRPLFPPATNEHQLEACEEALDRLDEAARACGQTAESVLAARVLLRPEVTAQLQQPAVWPYTVISRQLSYALEDFTARAARQPHVAAESAPRRDARAKPAWMSDDEWQFRQDHGE